MDNRLIERGFTSCGARPSHIEEILKPDSNRSRVVDLYDTLLLVPDTAALVSY